MALPATWTTKMRVLNLSAREVSVTATRTETIGEEETTHTITIRAKWPEGVSKAAFLAGVRDSIWAVYQTRISKEANVAAIISDCETLLAGGLNDKEVE